MDSILERLRSLSCLSILQYHKISFQFSYSYFQREGTLNCLIFTYKTRLDFLTTATFDRSFCMPFRRRKQTTSFFFLFLVSLSSCERTNTGVFNGHLPGAVREVGGRFPPQGGPGRRGRLPRRRCLLLLGGHLRPHDILQPPPHPGLGHDGVLTPVEVSQAFWILVRSTEYTEA